MTENNFALLSNWEQELGVDIPNELFDKAEYLIFLANNDSDNLNELPLDNIIGFTHTNMVSIGDTYLNPFDDQTYLKIIDVDPEKEHVMVVLRRIDA